MSLYNTQETLYDEKLYKSDYPQTKTSSDTLNLTSETSFDVEYTFETVIYSNREIKPKLFISRPDDTWVEVTDYLRDMTVDFGNVDQLGTGNMAGDAVVRQLTFTLQNDRNDIYGDSFHPMDKQSSWNRQSGSWTPLLYPLREVVARVAIDDGTENDNPGNTYIEKELLQSGGSSQTEFQLDRYPIIEDSVTVYFDGVAYEDSHLWNETTSKDETYIVGQDTTILGSETTGGEEFINTLFDTDEDIAPYTVDEDNGIITFEDDISTKVEASYIYYENLFSGYLGDSIDSSPDGATVTCECRDRARLLQDTYIETKREYGSEAGTPAQTVIQNILDDNLDNPPTLYTPVDPGFDVLPYKVDYQSVWDAIQQVASQFGWFLGYLYNESSDSWRLTLKEPPRDKTTSDYAITAYNDFYERNLELKDSEIRNVVTVRYRDASDNNKVKTITVSDTDSINEFRRRTMTIGTKDTPLIDTSSEAEDFANALLHDLKDITSTSRITMPLFTDIDLFSTIKVFDPRLEYETSMYAVESLKHIIDAEGGKMVTEAVTSGTIIGSHNKWMRMETRPGADGNPIDVEGTTTFHTVPNPNILDYEGTYKGFNIKIEKPEFKGWDGFEIHASTSGSGFTPDDTTLVAKGKQTRFEVNGLQGDTTYYVKVISYDIDGNESAAVY